MGSPDAATLEPPTGARLALLKRLGFDELEHDSHVPFLSHLVGTRRVLASWGERPAMCDAGLFHSAYGTEYFEPEHPASRAEVQALIGDEAEEIAHAWCTIRRDTIERTEPATVIDRTTGHRVELPPQLLTDVVTLWAADTVEQIARMAPDERAFSHGIVAVLDAASPAARAAVEGVLPLIAER